MRGPSLGEACCLRNGASPHDVRQVLDVLRVDHVVIVCDQSDQAGLSARVIADQLGHARPSMTQDVYMGRKAVDPRAVAALEEALGHKSPRNGSPDASVGQESPKNGY